VRWALGLTATWLFVASAVPPVVGTEQSSSGQPTFTSRGVTVRVPTTVVDASHRLVTDLGADVFSVTVDGGVQPITVFERKVLPVSVLMLLDASESMKDSIGLLRDASRQFLSHMLPNDRFEIGAFNNQIRWVRPFTSDRPTLNRVLDFFTPRLVDYGTALWPAICEGLKELSRETDHRRVLLVFSDGENNIGSFNKCLIVARAIAEETMIYGIALKTEYTGIRGRTKSILDPLLPRVVDETGGGYFELDKGDDLIATFQRVAEELHSQYELGFEAPNLDGKTHDIAVRVAGSGFTARTRKSYLAAKPK
jgi:Ca-activated chloride channel family protein